MKLFEILNTVIPFKITYKSKGEVVYKFSINELDYVVELHKLMDKDWQISFFISNSPNLNNINKDNSDDWGVDVSDDNNDEYTKSNTGNELAVFSTVIKIITDFLKTNDVDELGFSARNVEPSRVKLYTRLMSKYKIPGYIGKSSSDSRETFFHLIKNK